VTSPFAEALAIVLVVALCRRATLFQPAMLVSTWFHVLPTIPKCASYNPNNHLPAQSVSRFSLVFSSINSIFFRRTAAEQAVTLCVPSRNFRRFSTPTSILHPIPFPPCKFRVTLQSDVRLKYRVTKFTSSAQVNVTTSLKIKLVNIGSLKPRSPFVRENSTRKC